MKREWVRLYTDVPNDPKVQRLTGPMFKFWINCLCLAGQFDGFIPNEDDLVFRLGLERRVIVKWTETLRDLGVFDVVENRLKPHNWDGRQYVSDLSNERVKKHRAAKCNVTRNAIETPSDTDTEADTDTEQKKPLKPPTPITKKTAKTRAVFVSDAQAVAFAEFWNSYWRKTHKDAAEGAYAKAITTTGMQRRVLAAVAVQSHEMNLREMHHRPHAATWLNGRRWNDEMESLSPELAGLSPTMRAVLEMP